MILRLETWEFVFESWLFGVKVRSIDLGCLFGIDFEVDIVYIKFDDLEVKLSSMLSIDLEGIEWVRKFDLYEFEWSKLESMDE